MPFKKGTIRPKKKLIACIREMYEMFEPILDKPPRDRINPWLDANDFRNRLLPRYSMCTMMKAKQILDIRSERIRGHFRWHLPKHSPDALSSSLHEKRLDSIARAVIEQTRNEKFEKHASTQELRDRMQYMHCDAPATEMLEGMLQHFSYRTIASAKKSLGIVSKKIKGVWHWVYPSTEACVFLENRLMAKAVLIEELEKNFAQRGWSLLVLQATRERLGNIKLSVLNHRAYWYDMARTRPPVERDEN